MIIFWGGTRMVRSVVRLPLSGYRKNLDKFGIVGKLAAAVRTEESD